MEKLTKKEKKELKKQEWQEKLKKQNRQKAFKKIAIWAGAAVILIITVYGLINLANSPQVTKTSSEKPPLVTSDDPVAGSPSAKVTLMEYADFQCPACAAFHPMVKQLLAEYKDKIYFVYRYFPLINIHKNAMISAQAAYAAGQQNKFWEMHDMLFETQNSWADSQNPEATFADYAEKLNLDINKFNSDIESDKAKSFVQDTYSNGLAIGINSTPTFYINGTRIENPRTYDDFKSLIENEINKK